MNIDVPLQLLGGVSAQTFLRRYWQKKPLLIRSAIPGMEPLLSRAELVALAGRDDVESRLVVRSDTRHSGAWSLKQGPFSRSRLPAFKQAAWTLLVQGVDGLNDRAHQLLQQFRFIPDARLDDLMVSYATDGGGVGPHVDSYDVFLLQAAGTRRWRIGRQKDLSLVPDLPLKILANFVPEQEFLLEPGDMLYLPPRYAHDGIAEGECMTYSIGFRAPSKIELARELLQRMAEHTAQPVHADLYKDPNQEAVACAAQVPASLSSFAQQAVLDALAEPGTVACALGEYLTEPKPQVWFEGSAWIDAAPIQLDRRTRMMYDEKYVFINGESFRASGTDAKLMRELANSRTLGVKDVARLSSGAAQTLKQWCAYGWLRTRNE